MTKLTFSSMTESKYLKKEDLDQERGNLVTIEGFKRVNVAQGDDEPDYKFVMSLTEFEKPLVLNATNRQILAKIYGDDVDDCIGQRVVLYVDENVSYGGKIVGGIRIRAAKKPASKPAPAGKPVITADELKPYNPDDDMVADPPF